MMKTLFKYLFVMLSMMAMTIGFSACSDDDDDKGSSSSIVGTWAYEEEYDDDEYYYEEITFKANGTFIAESEEYYYGEYDSSTYRGTWEIDGDELIVGIDDEHIELRIISLTSKRLVLENDEDETIRYYRVDD